jgi:hypothetical protein
MDPLTYLIGMDGFVWFMGVIEDTADPLKVGRAKVRIVGHHTEDKLKLSTNDLPWAMPLAPVTDATRVPNYKPSDWVVGFFMDGKLAQQPIILGVLPAIPQGSPFKSLAKVAVKTYIKSQTGL